MLRFIFPLLFCLLATAQTLPPEIEVAIRHTKIPPDAISIYAIEANPNATKPLLSYQAQTPMNPASVMKLVTSVAALDLLGSAYTWQTQVFVDGTINGGVLDGNLTIKGGGDPKMVVERLWLLLRRVQSLGIKTIHGDIILDSSAFDVKTVDAAAFDGAPSRPYNASPDALLVNFKSLVMTFTPRNDAGVATVEYDPPLHGVAMPASVPLSNGNCNDYRTSLKAEFTNPLEIHFAGGYPRTCGDRTWSIAYADPAGFASRAMLGLWEVMGGRLTGQVRTGSAPLGLPATFALQSPTLPEVLRDMNKFSNNVMAQQLFLSLSLSPSHPATFETSRAALNDWWQSRYGKEPNMPVPSTENGSGLSRTDRVTAFALARMLQDVYAAPYMPELMSSLPIVGLDGTMRNSLALSGAAHLKTGTLNNALARAGYIDSLSKNGKRYVLVAIINSDNPSHIANAHSVFDALINWIARQ